MQHSMVKLLVPDDKKSKNAVWLFETDSYVSASKGNNYTINIIININIKVNLNINLKENNPDSIMLLIIENGMWHIMCHVYDLCDDDYICTLVLVNETCNKYCICVYYCQ